jgi:enamine deaminase RidA (YjgF/YER057c/UK114 family)
MGKRIIVGENVEGLPISEAVQAGGFVFFSGLVAADSEGRVIPGGIVAETDHILHQVEATLSSIGASLSDVVKVNAVITNPEDFDGFNAAYRRHFHTKPPARITTCARLLIGARVELDFVAYVGDMNGETRSSS